MLDPTIVMPQIDPLKHFNVIPAQYLTTIIITPLLPYYASKDTNQIGP